MEVFDLSVAISVLGREVFVHVQVTIKGGLFIGVGVWTEKAGVEKPSNLL